MKMPIIFISGLILTLILGFIISKLMDWNDWKDETKGCAILDDWNIREYIDCFKITEEFCNSINCTKRNWNCGRPVCCCGC